MQLNTKIVWRDTGVTEYSNYQREDCFPSGSSGLQQERRARALLPFAGTAFMATGNKLLPTYKEDMNNH